MNEQPNENDQIHHPGLLECTEQQSLRRLNIQILHHTLHQFLYVWMFDNCVWDSGKVVTKDHQTGKVGVRVVEETMESLCLSLDDARPDVRAWRGGWHTVP